MKLAESVPPLAGVVPQSLIRYPPCQKSRTILCPLAEESAIAFITA